MLSWRRLSEVVHLCVTFATGGWRNTWSYSGDCFLCDVIISFCYAECGVLCVLVAEGEGCEEDPAGEEVGDDEEEDFADGGHCGVGLEG